jgi:hypothetical protein
MEERKRNQIKKGGPRSPAMNWEKERTWCSVLDWNISNELVLTRSKTTE